MTIDQLKSVPQRLPSLSDQAAHRSSKRHSPAWRTAASARSVPSCPPPSFLPSDRDPRPAMDGILVARTERFLDHLARPIDLGLSGGNLYFVEYCRQTEAVGPGSAGYGVGGRVLEVTSDP